MDRFDAYPKASRALCSLMIGALLPSISDLSSAAFKAKGKGSMLTAGKTSMTGIGEVSHGGAVISDCSGTRRLSVFKAVAERRGS